MAEFTHLHLHSTYSMLDGAIRPGDLVDYCAENGMSSVAITDHGNMFAAIEFYQAARKKNIKPIMGCEFYVAPGSRFAKKNIENLADGNAYHLVLLARDNQGYQNLIKLASLAYTEGFYYKPRIDYEILEQYSSGLVGLTACLAGEVPRHILRGDVSKASNLAGRLKEILDPGCFFMEIQDHGLEDQKKVTPYLIDIANRNNIPLVATNDSHFLRPDDHEAQTTLLRIQMNKRADEEMPFSFNSEFFVKTPEQMSQLFRHHPEAISNTQRIAEMCNVELDFGQAKLPHFETPDGEPLNEFLYSSGLKGLKERYGENPPPEVRERFDYEYKVITNMDFAGYFLIVQDFINHARQKGISVGPGRGSAAGSILSYSLGITNVDPLRYDLLFERFLNPDRNEMPDIDIDFSQDRREEVIEYVRDKYGEDHVGQIITFGTLQAKAVIKDVARVFGVPFNEINQATKLFPDKLGITLEEALRESPELRQYAESGEINQKIFSIARRLEGGVRHAGKHAAGVVIGPAPLSDMVPLYRESGSEQIITQFEKGAVEKIGLVKMDFLGLRNLTVIDYAVNKIKERRGVEINIDNIPMDDTATYELLSRGESEGVFQLESSGMQELLVKAKPREFEDIVSVLALYRPGPLNSGMVDDYIARKNGLKQVTYPHPDLEPVLKPTYGVIVYQEQVMRISQVIGGFSMAQADKLRKAMGKKIREIVADLKQKFMDGAAEQGYDKKMASDLYDLMAGFAEYGFNKSHSVAYAMVTYQTAWLKTHYRVEYLTALLASEIHNADKLSQNIEFVRNLGVEILGPDINQSHLDFTIVDDNTIRFGLAAIKNVGGKAVESIVNARAELGRPFENIFELAENIDLRTANRKVFEALIFSGALDSLKETRHTHFEMIEAALAYGQNRQADRLSGQSSLFGSELTESMLPQFKRFPEWPPEDLLRVEKEAIGFFVSGHPLDPFRESLRLSSVRAIGSLNESDASASGPPGFNRGDRSRRKQVEIAGIISDYRKLATKKDNREMAVIRVEDFMDTIDVVIFPDLYARLRETCPLQKDQLIFIRGEFEPGDRRHQIKASDAAPLSQEILQARIPKEIHIVLEPEATERARLDQAKNLFLHHRGPHPVCFHLHYSDGHHKVIRAHRNFGIQMNGEVYRHLAGLFGPDRLFYSLGREPKLNFLRDMPEADQVERAS